MKTPSAILTKPIPGFIATAALLFLPPSLRAAELVYEPFDHPAPATLTGLAGGTGWSTEWTQDGASGTIHPEGLVFDDFLGNRLHTSGLALNTAGTETTRNFRTVAGGPLNDVWVSFLYQLPGSNSNFEGINFLRGTTQLFSVSNASTEPGALIRLENLAGSGTMTISKGQFGVTHLIVLKLSAGAGPGGLDRVELFIDPYLNGVPSAPDHTIHSANFSFDRLRIAAQNGSSLLVDELRVGHSYAAVTPHDPVPSFDTSGDGLTDAQKIMLGLDPFADDSELFANIRQYSHFFDLYDSGGMLALGNGGVVIPADGDGPVGFSFEVQQSEDLLAWPDSETITRWIELPAGKNFLRVTLQNP